MRRKLFFAIIVLLLTPLAYGQGVVVFDADHTDLPPLGDFENKPVVSSMTKAEFQKAFVSSAISTTPVLDTNHANDTKLFAPIVVGGGGYTTRLLVTSMEVVRAITNLYLIAPDAWKGQNLKLLMSDGTSHDAAHIGAIMELKGALSFELTEAPDKIIVAWAYASVPTATFKNDQGADMRVDTAKVSAAFSFAPTGSITGQAAIQFVPPSPCWILPVRVSRVPGKDISETSWAIANPNTVAASLTVELRDILGNVKDSYQLSPLPPGSMRSQFLTEAKPLGVNVFEGSVKMCSNVPFLATTLQTNTSATGVFSYSTGDPTAVGQ